MVVDGADVLRAARLCCTTNTPTSTSKPITLRSITGLIIASGVKNRPFVGFLRDFRRIHEVIILLMVIHVVSTLHKLPAISKFRKYFTEATFGQKIEN